MKMNALLFILISMTLLKSLDGGRVVKTQGHNGPIVDEYGLTGTPKQSWAYVTVRPKAHMFYWLYYTSHSAGHLDRPLIMWLQGGPGGSGTGFGNFQEFGPLDADLKPRNTTWLQVASLLFVDNPVGTGYSYVEDDGSFTTNINDITADLLQLVKAFIKDHKDFSKVPFYIFSESYGGKMTAAFSAVLQRAIEDGEVNMNFKGFAMGDSWISPVDSVLSWGPYLKATSIVSQNGVDAINKGAKKCQDLVEAGKFAQATNAWSELEDIIEEVGSGVNFYNIMDFGQEERSKRMQGNNKDRSPLEKLHSRHVRVMQAADLDKLMNGPIRKKLKIIPNDVTWGGQSAKVFVKQSKDFMKNVTDTVNSLINADKLKVIIYSGQLDLICDILGTEAWFSRLTISKKFKDVEKKEYACGANKPVCYFGSHYKNLDFYWILNAGHMVPADNGPGALAMVTQIIG